MSSDSTELADQNPHYAYLIIRIFPSTVPADLAVLCHYGSTNDVFFPGGLVELSPSRCRTVQTFLLTQLRDLLGFYQPFNQFSKMHLYWEQDVLDEYEPVKYSLYIMDVSFRDFIEKFRNIGGAQAIVSNINFQEELFNLEHSSANLVSRTELFEPPSTAKCQYANKEIKIYDYENREPKTACVDYGLLVPVSEIKNNLGIDTGIVPKIAGFPMQKSDDQHKMWAHALAIYNSTQFSMLLAASQRRPNVPKLTGAPIVGISNYIQKLPNVNGDNLNELDSHLAQAPIKLTAMGVDPDTKQASLILMSSFTGKLGHWAQQNTEVLYNLNSVSQLVDFVRSSFVVKDYQAEHLQLLIKCEQNGHDISEYIRKFNDSFSFWKSDISEKCAVYLFVLGLRSGPLRADLMSAYGLGKFKSLSELQLHASRSTLSRLPTVTQKAEAHKSTTFHPRGAAPRKGTWRGPNKPLGSPNPLSLGASAGASGGASGSGTSGHSLSQHGQKRKLPPHEQKKKDSWLKAKQKLSSAEFQQRLKTGSCINCGEQGHIFEACTKPKPS
jgi:hypothetical protein